MSGGLQLYAITQTSTNFFIVNARGLWQPNYTIDSGMQSWSQVILYSATNNQITPVFF